MPGKGWVLNKEGKGMDMMVRSLAPGSSGYHHFRSGIGFDWTGCYGGIHQYGDGTDGLLSPLQ